VRKGSHKEPEDRTKAIAESSLERLFRRADVAVREKCLWRLLYETAARAEEVLSSNVDDLELENKRLRARLAIAVGLLVATQGPN
jgi:integrase